MKMLKKLLSIVMFGAGVFIVSTGVIQAKPVSNDGNLVEITDVTKKEVMAMKTSYESDKSEEVETRLKIESLNIDLPILDDLTHESLLIGAGVMSSEPGVGNYALAGHNMKDKNLLFGNLMNIELGTEVIVEKGNTKYIYQISETTVVPETATYMIDQNISDSPIISLMTCYYTSKTGKRFFAIGELIAIEENN